MGKRNTNTILDPSTVQICALLEKGITEQREFEDAFLAQNKRGLIDSAPKNAWLGNTMKFRAAEQVASFLGVKCYTELKKPQEDLWHKLMTRYKAKDPFIDLYVEPKSLGVVDFGLNHNDGLDEISFSDSWSIDIQGKINDEVLIILRNESGFYIIAPIRVDSCEGYANKFTTESLRYPSPPASPLSFTSNSDIGWQEIIVITSSKIDIVPHNPDTGDGKISFDSLNRFAYRLLDSKREFKVGIHKFLVVDD